MGETHLASEGVGAHCSHLLCLRLTTSNLYIPRLDKHPSTTTNRATTYLTVNHNRTLTKTTKTTMTHLDHHLGGTEESHTLHPLVSIKGTLEERITMKKDPHGIMRRDMTLTPTSNCPCQPLKGRMIPRPILSGKLRWKGCSHATTTPKRRR